MGWYNCNFDTKNRQCYYQVYTKIKSVMPTLRSKIRHTGIAAGSPVTAKKYFCLWKFICFGEIYDFKIKTSDFKTKHFCHTPNFHDSVSFIGKMSVSPAVTFGTLDLKRLVDIAILHRLTFTDEQQKLICKLLWNLLLLLITSSTPLIMCA